MKNLQNLEAQWNAVKSDHNQKVVNFAAKRKSQYFNREIPKYSQTLSTIS